MLSLASAGPSAYWYLTRGTGTVALILLTFSVTLGVANVRRLQIRSMPRFVLDAVHRRVALLAVVFVVVHILTTVLDGYVPITLIDAVVPFVSAYRPLWLSLGAVAFDLLLAVAITSLLRRHLGYRAWRATHWAAYASWPVALVHGLGTGSDSNASWMLAVVVGCLALVLAAVVSRIKMTGPLSRVPGRAGDGRPPQRIPGPADDGRPPAWSRSVKEPERVVEVVHEQEAVLAGRHHHPE